MHAAQHAFTPCSEECRTLLLERGSLNVHHCLYAEIWDKGQRTQLPNFETTMARGCDVRGGIEEELRLDIKWRSRPYGGARSS